MGRIAVLDEKTCNAIKAGEVIERPVSVIKELTDNSIDSGATRINIEFKSGGISSIRVVDNGIGMDRDDIRKAFLVHATSKITSIEDIYSLTTMGFRGEALASIAACSDISITSRREEDSIAYEVKYINGSLSYEGELSASSGTTVTVKNLFKNIPARYKFLKRDSTEGMYICDYVEKIAIANPQIAFTLIKDDKVVLKSPGTGDTKDAIYSIYGKEIASSIVPISYEFEGFKLRGYAGLPKLTRGNRSMQIAYVNDRVIKSKTITAAIDEAYKNSLMKGKYPLVFLFVYASGENVDVNVHPQKSEVRFSDDSTVFKLVYHGLRNSLFDEASDVDSVDRINTSNESATLSRPSQAITYSANAKSSFVPFGERERVNTNESKATLNMLEILSSFKPDIELMSEDSSVDQSSTNENEPSSIDSSKLISDSSNEEPSIDENDPSINDKQDIIEKFSLEYQGGDILNGDIAELCNDSVFRGIVFNTYIIMQSKDSMFFVDQHAAHERVLYEKHMNMRTSGQLDPVATSALLVPQVVEVTLSEYLFLEDNLQEFINNGFDLELMGERQVAIRAIPIYDSSATRLTNMDKPSLVFTRVLEDMKKENSSRSGIWYSLIQTTACKAAIKANDVISEEEALELIRMLRTLKDPYHCAHGRPTFYKISKTELERKFKRIL